MTKKYGWLIATLIRNMNDQVSKLYQLIVAKSLTNHFICFIKICFTYFRYNTYPKITLKRAHLISHNLTVLLNDKK